MPRIVRLVVAVEVDVPVRVDARVAGGGLQVGRALAGTAGARRLAGGDVVVVAGRGRRGVVVHDRADEPADPRRAGDRARRPAAVDGRRPRVRHAADQSAGVVRGRHAGGGVGRGDAAVAAPGGAEDADQPRRRRRTGHPSPRPFPSSSSPPPRRSKSPPAGRCTGPARSRPPGPGTRSAPGRRPGRRAPRSRWRPCSG